METNHIDIKIVPNPEEQRWEMSEKFSKSGNRCNSEFPSKDLMRILQNLVFHQEYPGYEVVEITISLKKEE